MEYYGDVEVTVRMRQRISCSIEKGKMTKSKLLDALNNTDSPVEIYDTLDDEILEFISVDDIQHLKEIDE